MAQFVGDQGKAKSREQSHSGMLGRWHILVFPGSAAYDSRKHSQIQDSKGGAGLCSVVMSFRGLARGDQLMKCLGSYTLQEQCVLVGDTRAWKLVP